VFAGQSSSLKIGTFTFSVFGHLVELVVIDKNDIRKQLRQTDELLKRCDEDKARLEEDIKNLHQELVSCQKISAGLEKLLGQYESHERDVT
jgi:chromosome segregation ATPase